MIGKWIWLNEDLYPDRQKCPACLMSAGRFYEENPDLPRHIAAEFSKNLCFNRRPEQITLRVSASTRYRLFVNDRLLGDGPALPGGDWLTEAPLDWQFYDTYCFGPETDVLRFSAFVRAEPVTYNEFSRGQGGFILSGEAVFADGHREEFGTDAGWLCRPDARSISDTEYDFTRIPDPFAPAGEPEIGGELIPAETRPLELLPVLPRGKFSSELSEGQQADFDFDRIYSAYLGLNADGPCRVCVSFREVPGKESGQETVTFDGAGGFRGTALHSVGELTVTVEKGRARVMPMLWYSRYPVDRQGSLVTSDEELDLVWHTCKHTLEICRQSIHLDSPLHQEMLACTGDYYIETLGTAMAFGDLSLAEADIRRTARWLMQNDGRMFHTTYSLIWVQWIRRVYEFTGSAQTAFFCLPALKKLLKRFEGYVDKTGLVGNPPDYMFVDWVMAEGYSMHHPPKSLGQSVLNAFYYKALTDGAYLAKLCGEKDCAEAWRSRAAALRRAFHERLFDESRGLYRDGLDDPATESGWQPANVPLKHFSRYPNALAVNYDLCPQELSLPIAQKVWQKGGDLPEVQPYFKHFIYEMGDKTGLLQAEGVAAFDEYRPLIRACAKGLQEGWLPPTPGYRFDYSHAWGGSPLYHLPKLLLGLTILEPGWKHIRLSPGLYGLSHGEISVPTPYGELRAQLRRGCEPVLSVPSGIRVDLV